MPVLRPQVLPEPGVGSNAAVRQGVGSSPPPPSERTMTAPEARTVLVVEDEDAVRAIAARMLVAAGFAVVTAADGVEAMAVLDRTPGVAVVLTDLQMPRMDGYKLAEQLLAHPDHPRLVFMTGMPEASLTQDLPGPLLIKPFTEGTLTSVIRAVVAEATDREEPGR
jgi:two-component system, cell cycle sensor histidine kinase and response regulator CckA